METNTAAQDLADELKPKKGKPKKAKGPSAETAKGDDTPTPASQAETDPVEPEASEPEAAKSDSSKRRFSVTLVHTNGEGTPRPPFIVELDMSLPAGEPERVEPLSHEDTNAGVRVFMVRPEDDFEAGMTAQERAIQAFNDHYHIRQTEHKHKVGAA